MKRKHQIPEDLSKAHCLGIEGTTSPETSPALSSATGTIGQHIVFMLLGAASFIVFHKPLSGLVLLAYHSDYYSHTVVIPLLAGYLIYRQRKQIFACTRPSIRAGVPLLVAGMLLFVLQGIGTHSVSEEAVLSLSVFSVVLFWIGAFTLSYGAQAFRASLFPLLLLFLTVPPPLVAMESFVNLTRVGSAEIASLVFRAFGVPVYRHGFLFVLPGVAIEIAKECSGIHSTLALFILTLASGYLFLRRPWKRAFLLLFVFPIVSLTNGVRIATLTLIAEYFDKNIFNTDLHRDGGIFFFLLAFVLIGLALRLLQERKRPQTGKHHLPTLSQVAGAECGCSVAGDCFPKEPRLLLDPSNRQQRKAHVAYRRSPNHSNPLSLLRKRRLHTDSGG